MLDDLWFYRGTFLTIATIVLFLIAMRWGEAPERLTACILLGVVVATRVVNLIASDGDTIWTVGDYFEVNVAHLAIDTLAAIFLVPTALWANRIYPLWIAGFQLTAVLTHFGREVSTAIHPVAYATMNRSTFYFQIVFMLAGLVLHMRRTRRFGTYPSWRRTSDPSSGSEPIQ